MLLGVNVPNFGPGTDPGVLRDWARVVEGLGFDILMVSDHVAVTADVGRLYPAPFYDPFTALSWLAGVTTRVQLGTTVLVLPYRHPLLVARTAANLHELSGGRFVLGVGVGWAQQEFAALNVPFERRGALTDEYLAAIRTAWLDDPGYRGAASIPLWVGGNGRVALRRARRFDAAWHPLRRTLPELRAAVLEHRPPAFAPRIALRLTATSAPNEGRPAGVGTLEQVRTDLRELRALGAVAVVLDPYDGDPDETRRPEAAWRALSAVAAERDDV